MLSRIARLLCLLCAPLANLVAQQEAEVVYNHYTECKNVTPSPDGCTVNETKALEPGGTLRVRVKLTRSDLFTVDVRGYSVRSSPTSAAEHALLGDDDGKKQALAEDPKDSVAIELTHNAKYGGYIVTISPSGPIVADNAEVVLTDGTKLHAKMPGPAVVIVTIQSQDPPYAFSGGISLTGLRDQAFVARPAATAGTYTIVEDDARRDAATVGFATFVNVRPFPKLSWFWPGVGIGLETGGSTQYYFSLGVRMQRGIYLNTGAVLGRVAALPPGLQEGDQISDPNQLSNLSRRSAFSVFLGLSFTFLGGGQQTFGRPFVGAAEK